MVWTCGGQPGLGHHRLADLVYGIGTLLLAPPTAPIVVTEGEKACDAVRDAGLLAAATVCGAASTPGPAVISYLAMRPVVLFFDSDGVGRAHMGRLGVALEAARVPAIAVVRPPEGVPVGWDAADASPELIRDLVADASTRWIGPVAA